MSWPESPTSAVPPKSEPIVEQCGNCLFWRPRTDGTAHMGGGYCVRFPPIFEVQNALNDGWPNTSQQSWCGEWQGRPTA